MKVVYYVAIFLLWSIPFGLYFQFGFGDNSLDQKWTLTLMNVFVATFLGLAQVLWTYLNRKYRSHLEKYPDDWGQIRRIVHFLIYGRFHYEYP